MSYSSLSELLANMGSAVGVGVLLDQILVGKSGQRALLRLVASQNITKSVSLEQRFHSSVKVIRDVFFFRFFGREFFSSRFFFASCFLSMVFISVITVYQNILGGSVNRYLSSDAYSVFLFICFIFLNMIVDYISTIQTNVFANSIVRLGNFSHTVFLVFGDIFSTMTIFKFLYAFGIFILLLFSFSLIQNQEFKSVPIHLEYSVKRSGYGPIYEYDIVGVRRIEGEDDEIFLSGVGNSELKYIDPIMFNAFYYTGNIVNRRIEVIGERSFDDNLTGVANGNDILYKIQARLLPLEIKFNWDKFASIFTSVAAVDYEFTRMIAPELQNNTISLSLGVNYGYSPFNNSKYCLSSAHRRGFLSHEVAKYLKVDDCKEVLIMTRGLSYGENYVMYDWNTAILSKSYPLSLFFISSFFPTILIYVLVASAALMGLVASLGRVMRRMLFFWTRAPFGVAGLVLGVALSAT